MRRATASTFMAVLVLGGAVATTAAGSAQAEPQPLPTISEIKLPASAVQATDMVVGPDGNLWVSLGPASQLARVTLDGTATEIALPGTRYVTGLARGSDGNLWAIGDRVYRVSPSGVVTSFPLPSGACCGGPAVRGGDGNVWFIASLQIGRVTPDGAITMYPLPPGFGVPSSLVAGPDGNVWYTRSGQVLGRVTPAGAITQFPAEGSAHLLLAGPDGTIWYPITGGGRIGRMRPDGSHAAPVPLPDIYTNVSGLGIGPDGAVWIGGSRPFYETQAFVARIDPSGAFLDFALPKSPGNEYPGAYRPLTGPDGALWFLMTSGRLGRLELATATRTVVTSSGSAVDQGQPVTFTARVEAPFHPQSPSGSVTFFRNRVALGPPVAIVNGSASLTVTLGIGAHVIQAEYGGHPPHRSSPSAGIVQFVRTAITIDAQPVVVGVDTAEPGSAWVGAPVVLVAFLSRVDGGPMPVPVSVEMVDASGRTLCWTYTFRQSPNYADCDITTVPDAVLRLVAGGGYTAILHETDLITGASDHAGLVEAGGVTIL